MSRLRRKGIRSTLVPAYIGLIAQQKISYFALVTYAGALVWVEVTQMGLIEEVSNCCSTCDEQAVMSWDSCSGVIFKYWVCFAAGSSLSLVPSIRSIMLLIESVMAVPGIVGGISKLSVVVAHLVLKLCRRWIANVNWWDKNVKDRLQTSN